MEEKTEVIFDTYRYCPMCDGKHKMPLTKNTTVSTIGQRKIAFTEIFNYCPTHDYELEVCKQLSEC